MTETSPTPTDPTTESATDRDGPRRESESASDLASDSDPAGDDEATPALEADGANGRLERTEIMRYLAWAALGVCSLLAVYALVQFYGSVTETIDLWVEPKHQPLMRAAFNLVVLLGSLIGISLLVRELDEP